MSNDESTAPDVRGDVGSDPSLDDGEAVDWASEGGATVDGAAAPGDDQHDDQHDDANDDGQA